MNDRQSSHFSSHFAVRSLCEQDASRCGLLSVFLAILCMLPTEGLRAAVTNQVSARFNHSVAVKSDGTVWTWGNNSNGQIGDGSTTQRSSPVQVAGVSAAVSVTAGYFHTLSLSSDGSVKA